MGCHTWHYRKIERTQQQATESCLKVLRHSRNLAWKIWKNPTNYCKINWNTTKEQQLQTIKVLNRQIKGVCNGYYKEAVWNRQDDEELTKYISGQGLYIEDTGFHDTFRIGGYPEDNLFSLEETLEFLKNNDKKIAYGIKVCRNPEADWNNRVWEEVDRQAAKEKSIERLKEFWNKYPQGMIQFG